MFYVKYILIKKREEFGELTIRAEEIEEKYKEIGT